MVRSEAIAIIKRGLGFRQTQDESIIAALQSAQRTLEKGKTLPLWLLGGAIVPVTPGVESIVLPLRFLRLSRNHAVYYRDSSGARVLLAVKNYNEAYDAYGGGQNTSGYPKVIVILTKVLASLLPVPQYQIDIVFNYYLGAEILDAEKSNRWLENAPDYIIGEAGMQVAMQLRDKDALSGFTAMRDRGRAAQLGDIIEDELTERGLVMGRDN